jgi:hypothetical protein
MGLDAVAAMKRAYDAGHADGGKYGWQADVSGPLVSKPDPARNGAQPPPNPFPK